METQGAAAPQLLSDVQLKNYTVCYNFQFQCCMFPADREGPLRVQYVLAFVLSWTLAGAVAISVGAALLMYACVGRVCVADRV